MEATQATVTDVAALIGSALGIEDAAADFVSQTPLFGELPELDSLGVVELAAALESRFGIVIDDEEFSADVFETVGSLTDFVASKQA